MSEQISIRCNFEWGFVKTILGNIKRGCALSSDVTGSWRWTTFSWWSRAFVWQFWSTKTGKWRTVADVKMSIFQYEIEYLKQAVSLDKHDKVVLSKKYVFRLFLWLLLGGLIWLWVSRKTHRAHVKALFEKKILKLNQAGVVGCIFENAVYCFDMATSRLQGADLPDELKHDENVSKRMKRGVDLTI